MKSTSMKMSVLTIYDIERVSQATVPERRRPGVPSVQGIVLHEVEVAPGVWLWRLRDEGGGLLAETADAGRACGWALDMLGGMVPEEARG